MTKTRQSNKINKKGKLLVKKLILFISLSFQFPTNKPFILDKYKNCVTLYHTEAALISRPYYRPYPIIGIYTGLYSKMTILANHTLLMLYPLDKYKICVIVSLVEWKVRADTDRPN